MLMDRLGYILSEAPVLILMIWFAVRLVQVRRFRENRPFFTEDDRRVLFEPPPHEPRTWRFYSRLALATAAFMTIGFLEILVLAPFGAAIVTGALLLTAAAVVRRALFRG